MRDAARGGAKTPSQRYRSAKTDSSRGISGSAGSSICSLGDPRKGLGIASRAGGGSGGAARKANSVSSRQPSRVTDKIRQIEQMVIMSKHSGWLQRGRNPVMGWLSVSRLFAQGRAKSGDDFLILQGDALKEIDVV